MSFFALTCHLDTMTLEQVNFHTPYLSFRHPHGAGLSGESGKGKHFEERLKASLKKPSLIWQVLIIHDANNFPLMANTRNSLYSFPYHCHVDLRSSENQFLHFQEKGGQKKKNGNEEVGIQVDCAVFKVLDQLWPSPKKICTLSVEWNFPICHGHFGIRFSAAAINLLQVTGL